MRSNSPKRVAASTYRQAALTWPRGSRLVQRCCFWLACLTSVALLGLVLFAPLLESLALPDVWGQVRTVFAEDPTVRRTALASAIGVLVTACIFFRPPDLGPPIPRLPRMHRPRREYDD